MAVIWGLDLHDMQWSKFKSSYMFGNTDYHMRRTKFIIYQCAMIFLVVSESLGTAVLSDYIDQQSALEKRFPGINVYNDDYVGIASYNIFVGVFAAIVFGAVSTRDALFHYTPLQHDGICTHGQSLLAAEKETVGVNIKTHSSMHDSRAHPTCLKHSADTF